jgi:hypothetical protein
VYPRGLAIRFRVVRPRPAREFWLLLRVLSHPIELNRVLRHAAEPAPNNETSIPDPDFSKVDDVGFLELMPSSDNGPADKSYSATSSCTVRRYRESHGTLPAGSRTSGLFLGNRGLF